MHTSGERPVVCKRDLTAAIQLVRGFSTMDVLFAVRTVRRLFLALSVTEPESPLVTLGGLETTAALARLGLSQVPLLDPVVVSAESEAGALLEHVRTPSNVPSAEEKHRSILTPGLGISPHSVVTGC